MRTALAIVTALVLLSSCSAAGPIHAEEPEVRVVPAPPRNACEAAFRVRLMSNLDDGRRPLPAIRDDDLVHVLNACTAGELVDANEYYKFGSGPPGGRLLVHRLFEGRHRRDQFDRLSVLCQRPRLPETKACQTQPAI